jgi:hypothetical protein
VPEVLAQLDRDAQLWAEWVAGATQVEIAERHGIAQQTVSAAVNRYSASIPAEEKHAYREQALAQLLGLYADHRDRARTSTRAATLCRQLVMDMSRLRGLVTAKVEHSGGIEHDHYAHPVEPSPTVGELLERWAREGRVRLHGELIRPEEVPTP